MSFSYTVSTLLWLGSVLSLCTTLYEYTDTVTFTLLDVFRANIFNQSSNSKSTPPCHCNFFPCPISWNELVVTVDKMFPLRWYSISTINSPEPWAVGYMYTT